MLRDVPFATLLAAAALAAAPQPAPLDTTPRWAPDGSAVAFVRLRNVQRRNLTSELYVVGRDGAHLRRLTRGARDFFLSWSPDADWLAFAGSIPSVGEGVFVVERDGSRPRLLFRAPRTLDGATVVTRTDLTDLSWSPDGTR